MDLRCTGSLESSEVADTMPLAQAPTMPRKPHGQDDDAKPAKNPVPVKMDRELHRKAKMIALSKGMELYEYLDSLHRPTIEKEFKQLFRGEPQ